MADRSLALSDIAMAERREGDARDVLARADAALLDPAEFDVTTLGDIARSPLRLRDWLNLNLPLLIGPRIDAFDPPKGQRGTILTIRGANFAASRADNQVTVGGADAPVLAASSTELKVLTTADTDTGPVALKVGTHTATAPFPFTVTGHPADPRDDGPPVFAMGAGAGDAGDVNPPARFACWSWSAKRATWCPPTSPRCAPA